MLQDFRFSENLVAIDIAIALNYNNYKTIRGEKSMTFGKYLKECIEKRGIPKAQLTKLSGMNRGKLYNVFDGKRKITEDELFSLIDKAGFSSAENDKLIDLYFKELYGKIEFSRIKYLENAIQQDNYIGEPCGFDSTGNDTKGSINNQKQLINSIAYMFYHDREIISNFSYRNKEIDRVVFDCVLNSQAKLIHIMDLSVDEMAEENLERIFASLKYMYNNCFPVYRYTNIKQMKYNNMFPYYFVGERYAVLYNDKNGIFIDNIDAVRIIRENVSELVNASTTLGTKPDDIMFVKSMYEKGSKAEGDAVTSFTYYPCIAKYVDYDFMYGVTKDEIPEKEMLVNVAYEHYRKFYFEHEFRQITTVTGIEKFAETGYFQEIPATYVNAASKNQRINVLKSLASVIDNGELFILDEDKLNMNPGMEIENHNKKLIVNGYDFEKENFASNDNFIVSFDDSSVTKTFGNFIDYIIHSKKVYSNEYAKRFIESLIVKLEHTNTN